MDYTIYPERVNVRLSGAIPIQPMRIVNRRRRRWPSRILFFTLGLLAGWVLRGGGAWLP